MVALIYLSVAVAGVVLAWRAFSADREDLARRDFVLLSIVIAVVHGSFSLVIFPGILPMRWVWTVSATFLPAATLQVLDRVLQPTGAPPSALINKLWVAAPLVSMLFLGLDMAFWHGDPGVTPPKVLTGGASYLGLGLIFAELWRKAERSPYRVERSRMRYLLALMFLAGIFSVLEGAARSMGLQSQNLSDLVSGSSGALQGVIPPVGALFTGLFLYCLYLVVTLERLLDLQELFSRLLSVGALALLLVGVDRIAATWVAPHTSGAGTTIYSTFQVFVASTLFLLAYPVLNQRVRDLSAQLLNHRGRQLAEALQELEEALPKVHSLEELGQVLLGRLHASGRFPSLSLYIHDPERGRVRRQAVRSAERVNPLQAVALSPFADGFARGEGPYMRQNLTHKSRREGEEGEAASRLRMMDAMSADVVIPLTSGDLVLGWLALKDEEWSDGLSHDEMARLRGVARRAAVIVENLQDFEAVKDQARLAALGTMSAGLAHEIRNPLAGIKGAAQYLQGEELPPGAQDFLQIILDEVDRLSVVVRDFLDYARPFELDAAPTDVNTTVAHILSLIRAEGLPPGITLAEDLAGDLPKVEIDAGKIQQVLLNLVRNAIEAMPQGGQVKVSTRLTASRNLRAVSVSVEDAGVGISKENLKDLFIPFYTTKQGGTGLGLAICERLIKAHNGDLVVESVPGKGSTFSFSLRVGQEDAPDPGAREVSDG